MTTPPRIVFLGTAAFAAPTLDALMASDRRPVAVYTRPDQPAGRGRAPRPSPVKARAGEYGLSVIEPATLRTPEAVEQLRGLEPTVLVTVAYGLILPAELLDVAPRGGLNVHPSLLPRHRGPAPVVWTLLEGDRNAGVSIFVMDAGVDSGPVLSQRAVPVRVGETAGELTERLAITGAHLLVETLDGWLNGAMTPAPQDEALATHSHMLKKTDGEMDFTQTAEELERRVLALTPWPGAFTSLDGKRLSILRAVALLEEYDTTGMTPGEVVPVRRSEDGGGVGVAIATGEGLLELLEVRVEGRRTMPAREFQRGRPGFIGASLPS